MKVLSLGMEWFPERGGGLDRVYYSLSHYLPKVGVEVQGLVAGSAEVKTTSGGTVNAFASAESSLPSRWRGVRQATQRLQQHGTFDLTAAHFALYTLPILDVIRTQPLVVHFHGPWALESQAEGASTPAQWVKWGIEKLTYQRAARFIVLSQAFSQVLQQTYKVSPDRIHIVPGGVDEASFHFDISQAEARSRLGWPCDRPILLTVRRLVQRMGLENLILAMATLRQQHPDALLLMAGKGPLSAALQAQIDNLGLENHVRLLGYVSDADLQLAYRAADVSVVPTVSFEGFGLTVVESLALGTPVLGTPVGGIPEILAPLSEALLFENSSPQALVKGLQEVLKEKRQLPDSTTCIDYAKAHFSWLTIAEKIKAVYQEALLD